MKTRDQTPVRSCRFSFDTELPIHLSSSEVPSPDTGCPGEATDDLLVQSVTRPFRWRKPTSGIDVVEGSFTGTRVASNWALLRAYNSQERGETKQSPSWLDPQPTLESSGTGTPV